MKVTFSIPDDLYEAYEMRAEGPGKVNLLLKETLERFVDAPPPSDRPITLDADQRRRLEAIADTTLEDGDEVCDLVERLAGLELGEIAYQFTIDQLVRLEEQAESKGLELHEYVDLAMERFWDWRCNL